MLWPVHNGLLRYSGFDALPPFVAHMPDRVGDEGRQAYLEAYGKRLAEIDKTPRLFFHPAEDYGKNERLKSGVLARSGVQQYLTPARARWRTSRPRRAASHGPPRRRQKWHCRMTSASHNKGQNFGAIAR